jgi:hypothetical protein
VPGASLQPPFFVMRPILVCLTPKSGYELLNPGKAPSGLAGEGMGFPYTGDPQERSIPDMVQCLLDNLNG